MDLMPPSITEKMLYTILNVYEARHLLSSKARAHVYVRVFMAWPVSIAAALDVIYHLALTIIKKISLILQSHNLIKLDPRTKVEMKAHIKRAGHYAKVMIVGSIAALIWPGVCKHFIPEPIILSTEVKIDQQQKDSRALMKKNISNSISQIIQNEGAQFNNLRGYWLSSSFNQKSVFVEMLSTDDYPVYANIRAQLSHIIYRPIDPSVPTGVRWLSNQQIVEEYKKINKVAGKTDVFCQAFYFHATRSRNNIKSILLSKKIAVTHNGRLQGAFVKAGAPEYVFGEYVLAFRRNIERPNPVWDKGIYPSWVGFSEEIPVNEKTLAYIILQTNDEKERGSLEDSCLQLTGRKISVFLEKEITPYLNFSLSLGLGVPKEWPA